MSEKIDPVLKLAGIGEPKRAPAGWPWEQSEPKPIDMVLHCPACGMQHIDRDEGQHMGAHADPSMWRNPPHRSHLCRKEDGGCGFVWRPADVPTNGVERTKTVGKADMVLIDGPHTQFAGLKAEHGMAMGLLEGLQKDNDELRELLAIRVAGHVGLYRDDGELQDSTALPYIDFKRDSVEAIGRALIERGQLAYEERKRLHNAGELDLVVVRAAVERAAEACDARARLLSEQRDYSAELPAADAEALRQALELLPGQNLYRLLDIAAFHFTEGCKGWPSTETRDKIIERWRSGGEPVADVFHPDEPAPSAGSPAVNEWRDALLQALKKCNRYFDGYSEKAPPAALIDDLIRTTSAAAVYPLGQKLRDLADVADTLVGCAHAIAASMKPEDTWAVAMRNQQLVPHPRGIAPDTVPIIKAWAEGATVQSRYRTVEGHDEDEWRDVGISGGPCIPNFMHGLLEFRVKPEGDKQ